MFLCRESWVQAGQLALGEGAPRPEASLGRMQEAWCCELNVSGTAVEEAIAVVPSDYIGVAGIPALLPKQLYMQTVRGIVD